jgi:hypothetical protein
MPSRQLFSDEEDDIEHPDIDDLNVILDNIDLEVDNLSDEQ